MAFTIALALLYDTVLPPIVSFPWRLIILPAATVAVALYLLCRIPRIRNKIDEISKDWWTLAENGAKPLHMVQMKERKLERAKGSLVNSQAKRDEVRMISALAGISLGAAFGVPLSIAFGFLIRHGTRPPFNDWIANLAIDLSFFSFSIVLGCLIAFLLPFIIWRKDTGFTIRLPVASSLTVLFIWSFLTIVMTFVYGPFNHFLLQYLDAVDVFLYGALLFFPFMIIGVYITMPSLRPRIDRQLRSLLTSEFWHGIWKGRKSRRKTMFFVIGFAIIIIVDMFRALLR